MPSDDAMREAHEIAVRASDDDATVAFLKREIAHAIEAATRAAVEALAVRFDQRANEQDAIAEFGRASEFRRVAREVRAAGVTDRVLTRNKNDGGSSGGVRAPVKDADGTEARTSGGERESAGGAENVSASERGPTVQPKTVPHAEHPTGEPPSPTDAERLDWLALMQPDIEYDPLGNVALTFQPYDSPVLETVEAPSLREAVDEGIKASRWDAAMAARKEGGDAPE